MPDVGEGLTEAEILKWHVQPGETVTDGQVVCEVETAKAAVELPIPFNGVVSELRFPEGTTVDVGTPIITVDTGGPATGSGAGDGSVAQPAMETGAGAAADVAKEAAGAAEAASAAHAAGAAETGMTETTGTTGTTEATGADEAEPEGRQPVLVGYGVGTSSTKRRPRKAAAPAAEPAATREPAAANGHGAVPQAARPPVSAAAPAADGSRPLAKPPVRKLAKDLGVDLGAVTPTGPEGVVTRDDVYAAAAPLPERAQAQAPATTAQPTAAGAAAGPAAAPTAGPAGLTAVPAPAGAARETRIPVKGVRRATAQAMVDSAFTAPHVTEWVTVDVTRTMKLVSELKQDSDMGGVRVNPLLLVAKAFLLAIRRNPDINSAWDEERQEIVRKHYVNLGIAAATPRGLIVPNIKEAQDKTLPELASALSDLVGTAREGRTSPAAMSGGTVTITNVGVFGVDSGTPILNPGESAILAVGQIREQPWVHKGKVKPRHVTTLALSFDHRLVDGELGSKVLADTAAVLERPKRLMTWG
jgi:pyruvate dehydrogenase E2 component (dihydrolipoamide acetyltransferase)